MLRSSWPRTLVLGLVFAWAAPSPAPAAEAAAPARSLDKAQLKRYRAIMAEAVRAAKKGKHGQAIAAYDRALAIKPNDQAALTDQGWSAFLMGALDQAEASTRKALAVGLNGDRNAAGLYNLGRILEQRGDKPGAIDAYVQSLQWRPTRTVRERLATLDPGKAAEMDPLKPVPMLGPFANPEAFCQDPHRPKHGPCPYSESREHAKGIVPPYGDVLWFRTGASACHLAFKLAQGWFVDAKGEECPDDAENDWRVLELKITDLVPGGSPEVVFRTDTQRNELYFNDEGYPRGRSPIGCDARMMACGVPAKGAPSCVYLQTGKGEEEEGCPINDKDQGHWTWQLQPVFSADGQVEVKATGKPDGDTRLFLGRRPLAFP